MRRCCRATAEELWRSVESISGFALSSADTRAVREGLVIQPSGSTYRRNMPDGIRLIREYDVDRRQWTPPENALLDHLHGARKPVVMMQSSW